MSARANEPAYPCDGPNVPAYGLTIREAAAIAAMQGLIPVQFTYGEESILATEERTAPRFTASNPFGHRVSASYVAP